MPLAAPVSKGFDILDARYAATLEGKTFKFERFNDDKLHSKFLKLAPLGAPASKGFAHPRCESGLTRKLRDVLKRKIPEAFRRF